MKKKHFVIGDMTTGQLNAIIIKLGGPEGAMKFLRDETNVYLWKQKWYEKDGVIYTCVTSNGTTGVQWIEYFEKKGLTIGSYFRKVLLSDNFRPTTGVTTEIAIIKGMIFKEKERTTKDVRTEAERRNLVKPMVEIICLIRYTFTDEEIEAMGLLLIIGMHEPVKFSGTFPRLLGVFADGKDDIQLDTYRGNEWFQWHDVFGFAFAISPINTEV